MCQTPAPLSLQPFKIPRRLSLAVILLAHLLLQTLGLKNIYQCEEHKKTGTEQPASRVWFRKIYEDGKGLHSTDVCGCAPHSNRQTTLSAPSLIWINPSIQARAHFYFTRLQASNRSSVLTLQSMLKTLLVQQPGCQNSFNSLRRVCIRCGFEPDLGAVTKTVTKKKKNNIVYHSWCIIQGRIFILFIYLFILHQQCVCPPTFLVLKEHHIQ